MRRHRNSNLLNMNYNIVQLCRVSNTGCCWEYSQPCRKMGSFRDHHLVPCNLNTLEHLCKGCNLSCSNNTRWCTSMRLLLVIGAANTGTLSLPSFLCNEIITSDTISFIFLQDSSQIFFIFLHITQVRVGRTASGSGGRGSLQAKLPTGISEQS